MDKLSKIAIADALGVIGATWFAVFANLDVRTGMALYVSVFVVIMAELFVLRDEF